MNTAADKISDSEVEVMKVVWNKDGPVTYAQIRASLSKETGWESATINTLVKRLVNKGVLKQEKKDVYFYSPIISESDYIQVKTQVFVKKIYGGNVKGLISALIHYENVTQEDLENLHEFWRQGRRENE